MAYRLIWVFIFGISLTTARNSTVKIYNGGLTTVIVWYNENNETKRCTMKMEKYENSPEPISGLSGIYVTPLSIKEMENVINECHQISETKKDNDDDKQSWSVSTMFKGILPGTLWCGSGDIAKNYDDLGWDKNLDKCCRTHDHCPLRILPARYRFGLINFSIYTKSHCDCDKQLYNCLKKQNTTDADIVGNIYFNLLKIQCVSEVGNSKCDVRRKRSSCPNPTKYKFVNTKLKW